MARHYLDHASTSPLRPSAATALADWYHRSATGQVGDPGRIHTEGMTARALLESARERVAAWLGVRPREVVFTSGATESIATACWGARAADPARTHMVCAAVEHSAVRGWTARGDHSVVGVDTEGRIDPDELVAAVTDATALVHIQAANHEVPTRQPVAEVVATCRERGVRVHVDAAQCGAELPSVAALGADLVSISGHKLGAPVGIGVLVVRRGVRVPPLLVGGDQERARRAGTEDIAGALALAAVADELSVGGVEETERIGSLTAVVREWAADAEGVALLGATADPAPHLVCLALAGVEPQPVLLGLDQRGVAAHSGSSCSSEALEPSPVLEAMGVDAHRSLRLSAGWNTNEADIAAAISALEATLGELRALGVRPRLGRGAEATGHATATDLPDA